MKHQVKSTFFDLFHLNLWLMIDASLGSNRSLIRRLWLFFAKTAIKRSIILVDCLQQMIHSFCWLMPLPFQHVFLFDSVFFLPLLIPLDIDYLLRWFFVLFLTRRGWTFLLLRLRLSRVLRGRFDLLYISFFLVFFSAMDLQDAQILTCMIIIAQLARCESKELDKRVNVDNLTIMLSLVHLPIMLQYFVYFITEGDVLMANYTDEDMEKYDVLCVFQLLILVLEQFAVLGIDLAQQVLVDKQGYFAEVRRTNVLRLELVGEDDFDAGKFQFDQFAKFKELK